MNLIQRIAYRYLFAEESPPLHWDEFLNAKYEGGSKRVPNTNPKTKKRYPEVTMQTLFKSDDSFKKRVMEEYAEWVRKRDEKPESKKKSQFSTELLNTSLVDEREKDGWVWTQFPGNSISKKLKKQQTKQEVALRKGAHMVGIAFQKSLTETEQQRVYDWYRRWSASSTSPWARALQHIVTGQDADEFFTEEDKAIMQKVRDFQTEYLRNMGITHLTLYRGVKGQGLDETPPDDGDEIDVGVYGASSWTLDPNVAAKFGRIVSTSIPVEDILFSPLCMPGLRGQEAKQDTSDPSYGENEFVIARPDKKVKGTVHGPGRS